MGNCLNNGQPNVATEIEAANNNKETPKDKQVYGEEKPKNKETPKKQEVESKKEDAEQVESKKEEVEQVKTKNEEVENKKEENVYAQQKEKEKDEKEKQEKEDAQPLKKEKESNVVIIGSNVKIGGNVQIGTSGTTAIINKATNEVIVKKEVYFADDKQITDDNEEKNEDDKNEDDNEEEKNEDDIKYEADENAVDISIHPNIKAVASHPNLSDLEEQAKKAMNGQPYDMMMLYEMDETKDVWLTFDCGGMKIDSLEIAFFNVGGNVMNATIAKIHTSSDNVNFKLIKIKRGIVVEKGVIFYLKSKHDKYIKIAFEDRPNKGNVGITKLKLNGYELKENIKGSITDKISVYQANGVPHRVSDPNILLKNNPDIFEFATEQKAWIIFDCKRYELEKISVRFPNNKMVPGVVKLKLSDVAPRYSFNIPSVKKWKTNIPTEYSGVDGVEEDWKRISEFQEFKLSGTEYKEGFKRYAMLEFSKYHETQIQIVRIQVFGSVSQRIADNDEQFQQRFDGNGLGNEEKTDNKPYKPDFVDNSATQQGCPLENIWKKEDHFFWMGVYNTEPFLVVDLGNNEAKFEEMMVKAYPAYVYETLKISTSNKIKSGWQLLIEDNEMDKKMTDGGKYDMSKYNVKKYIKLEFFGLKMNMFALSQLKLYGDSEFLDKIQREISLEDIKNLGYKDEDVIQQYKDKIQTAAIAEMVAKHSECTLIEQDKTKGKGCDEWKKLRMEYYELSGKMSYMNTPMFAYTADTVYEQELLLETGKEQEKMAKEMANQLLQNELTYVIQEKKLKEEEQKANDEWQLVLTDIKIPQKNKTKLMKIYQAKQKQTQAAQTEYYAQYTKLVGVCGDKISKLFILPKSKKVYETWKEGIMCGGRMISNAYTVKEYENAVDQYGRINDKDGLKKCFALMADQFDKSIIEQREYLHKFLIYQLNSLTNYQSYARSANYGIDPVTIVFDVGEEFDGKVNRIEFKCNRIFTNTITISTADVLREEKSDSPDADVDEMQYEYNHFNVIGQLEFSDRNSDGVSYDDTRIEVGYANRRYIKVDFDKWDEKITDFRLEVERVKIYVKNEDDSVIDEDAKEGGEQLAKYKLKFVCDSYKKDDIGYERYNISDAYKLSSDEYRTPNGDDKPYIIFDAETRKVDKFETNFASWSSTKFKNFKVLTTDDYSDEKSVHAHVEDDWKIIFQHENISKAEFDKQYGQSGDAFKSIELNGKNEKYIMFLWELHEDSTYLQMGKLKFYTSDPADEYYWDIDANIKSLSYMVKIVSTNKCVRGQKAENMLKDACGQCYSTAVSALPHKQKIEDKIRDEVCRGLNLLRKSRGGKIAKHEKHFIKYLLCFQNKRNYNEMLYQAKLVMGLLRKPLDIEYNRLQSENSPILSLKLDPQYRCHTSIVSNHKLLEWDYNKWYKQRNALFWPQHLKPLADEWRAVGFILTDPEFKQLQRTTVQEPNKPFVTSDELAMEYLNLIAYRLDSGFQKAMKALFRKNRLKMGRSFPTGNADLNVQSGPVKTKARQKIKVDLKYFVKQAPQCMAVLDIVRCGIVCQDDQELCSLFQLIMEQFAGSIMRVKNAFDDIKKGDDSHGYRAVMINIAFGDESLLPKQYKMVCEAQLLLNKYYQVRKDMHLGYGICRSEDGGTSVNTEPFVVLARDCAKFGKLDI